MFDKKETLILVAMEEELPKEKAIGWNIIYTGVGKINASISIADSFYKYRP